MVLILDTLMISQFLGCRKPQARVSLHLTVLNVVRKEVRNMLSILDTVAPVEAFHIFTHTFWVDTQRSTWANLCILLHACLSLLFLLNFDQMRVAVPTYGVCFPSCQYAQHAAEVYIFKVLPLYLPVSVDRFQTLSIELHAISECSIPAQF